TLFNCLVSSLSFWQSPSDKIGDDGFSRPFAAYKRDFVQRHEGLSLLILESKDPDADFRAANIAGSDTMRFEPEGECPYGSSVNVSFSLAFADDAAVPEIHFATCQQRYPQNFRNLAFQRHATSVTGIAGVVVVAEQPDIQRNFFETFTGTKTARINGGFTIVTPRGEIDVLKPAAFVHRFGVTSPDVSLGADLPYSGSRLRIQDFCKAFPSRQAFLDFSLEMPL